MYEFEEKYWGGLGKEKSSKAFVKRVEKNEG